jgi:Flp pilus assembly protein protease CpaA
LIENDAPRRSFWTGRSYCIGCKKLLQWHELIPLVAYARQKWTCRECQADIPRWIWYMEWYMAFLWMVSAMILSWAGFNYFAIALHIVVLTGLSLLVIEDIRSRTIPDNRSMPLIALLCSIYIFLYFVPIPTLLPEASNAFLGAFIGMFFYMLQMIIPAALEVIRRRRFQYLLDICLSPFIFPLWMLVKAFFWEKKADILFPSLKAFDNLPTWVGGGDIRLGIIIGSLVWPYDFLYVVMYGYIVGTVYFLFKLIISRTRIQTLPVAPLLFCGVVAVWCLRIFLMK